MYFQYTEQTFPFQSRGSSFPFQKRRSRVSVRNDGVKARLKPSSASTKLPCPAHGT